MVDAPVLDLILKIQYICLFINRLVYEIGGIVILGPVCKNMTNRDSVDLCLNIAISKIVDEIML